jgi:hypothetical protein
MMTIFTLIGVVDLTTLEGNLGGDDSGGQNGDER